MGGAQKSQGQPPYISWRWRLLLPLFVLLLIVMMVGVYVLATLNTRVAAGELENLYAVEARFQLVRLMLTAVAGGGVIVCALFVDGIVVRVNRVRSVVDALAMGDETARTGMKAVDEIGALGQAIDRYAARTQDKQDRLRSTLRRQRREISHLNSVLESLPDGVIVQDEDGRVIVMNDRARELLGTQENGILKSLDFNDLTSVVTDVLGPSLAPGLYALGDPQHVSHDGRMLSAQAGALMTMAKQRVGTVIILRDMTDEVRRQRARDVLMDKLANQVHGPMADMGRQAAREPNPLGIFAREMTRHAVTLQKLISEMRELTTSLDTRDVGRGPRPLPLDTLIWALANEWKQVAQAANLTLHVQIEQAGQYVLGDERRLRWALGNLLDNAIKYTPPGGALSLDVKPEVNGMAQVRVRDNGVGISTTDMPHIFERFFRGNPVTDGGRILRAPGTGQGLSIAKEIIESHGGRLTLKSSIGTGTAVLVSLPLTAPVGMELPVLNEDMDGETVRLNQEDNQKR